MEVKFELGEETIVINYRHENLQFPDIPTSKELNYPYIYMGMQKALTHMVKDLSEGNEVLYLDEIGVPDNGLYMKLYNLMLSKHIEEINLDNLDEVIDKISDRMLNRFYATVKEMSVNAG